MTTALVFGVALVVALGVANRWFDRKAKSPQRAGAWALAARALDGRAEGEGGKPSSYRLFATVHDVAVEVDQLATAGRMPVISTRLRAAVPAARRFRLTLAPQGLIAELKAELAGDPDVLIGDPAFDSAFIVRCDQPGLAYAILDLRVRSALLLARELEYELDAGHVTARAPAALDDEVAIERAVRATAALAAAQAWFEDSWRRLADTLTAAETVPGAAARGFDVTRGGRVARVEPVLERGVIRVHVAASLGAPGAPDAATTEVLVTLAAQLTLNRAGVTLELTGVHADPARVERAIDLCLRLAQAESGVPYR